VKVKVLGAYSSAQPAITWPALFGMPFIRFLLIATILVKLYSELTDFYGIELPYKTKVINSRNIELYFLA
jgi:hypothetical protein